MTNVYNILYKFVNFVIPAFFYFDKAEKKL